MNRRPIITQAWLAEFYAEGVKSKYKGGLKRQASSTKRLEKKSTSIKRQATSVLILKSLFDKCQDTGAWKQFASSLTGLLAEYKCILRMLNMK